MSNSIVIIVGYTCLRGGTEADIKLIKKTFNNAEFHTWIDNSPQDLRQKMRDLGEIDEWREKWKRCKFLAVFCLAHGKADGQLCLLHKANECIIKDIINWKTLIFNRLIKIRELDGKLKWLIIQSCRGKLNDFNRNLRMQADGEADEIFLDHYVISYCTGEGTLSTQANQHGKVFIQEICAEVTKNGRNETLVQMLTNVNGAVEAYAKREGLEQYSRPLFERNCPDDFKIDI